MSQMVSKEQVAAHNKSDSLWIVIDEDVYDVTKFQDEHPGKCPAQSKHADNKYCGLTFCN
jgi:cytochrome b involved in lipid metabolism